MGLLPNLYSLGPAVPCGLGGVPVNHSAYLPFPLGSGYFKSDSLKRPFFPLCARPLDLLFFARPRDLPLPRDFPLFPDFPLPLDLLLPLVLLLLDLLLADLPPLDLPLFLPLALLPRDLDLPRPPPLRFLWARAMVVARGTHAEEELEAG